MNQRDLIATALKILGLCLIVLGAIAACGELVSTIYAHKTIQEYRDKQDASDDKQPYQSFSINLHKITFAQSLSRFAYRILQILVGIYFCKRGTLVLNFLSPETHKIAEQAGAAYVAQGATSADP